MQQRVSIARALATRPQLLLLDEPFGALDAFTRMAMQQEVLRIWEQDKTTMMIVTHDIDEALYLSDRILVLRGSPAKIVREVDVRMEGKTRQWLYDQGALKGEIHRCIKAE